MVVAGAPGTTAKSILFAELHRCIAQRPPAQLSRSETGLEERSAIPLCWQVPVRQPHNGAGVHGTADP